MSMTATDHINQQAVASYVKEAIWFGVSGGMITEVVSDDTKKGCITCWCGWKVMLGGNDTRNQK